MPDESYASYEQCFKLRADVGLLFPRSRAHQSDVNDGHTVEYRLMQANCFFGLATKEGSGPETQHQNNYALHDSYFGR